MIKVLNKKAIIAFLLSLSLVSCGTQQGERGPVGPQGEQGETGPQGPAGHDGVSVVSIDKTSSDGLVDTYTIFYSDGTSSSFNITNGQDGEQGIQGNPGQDGHNPVISIGANGNWFVDDVDTGIKAQGPKGDTGAQGIQGEKGADGTSVLTGYGYPDNELGKNGDSYIDLSSWDFYVKEFDWWSLIGNIKGENGQDGMPGINGEDGSNGIDGRDGVSIMSIDLIATSPENVDTYEIRYSDGRSSLFYVTNGADGPQGIQGEPGQDGHTPVITIGSNGNWFVDGADTGIKAQGPKGDTGEQGPQGEQGEKGKDGSSVLTGSGTPNYDLGSNGDSYINLLTWDYYVKENDTWTLKGNIKGETGHDSDLYGVTYIVTFDVQDGIMPEGYETTVEVEAFHSISNLPTPTKTDYRFIGWYNGLSLNDGQFTTLTPVTRDMTVYARYESYPLHAVTFHSNGGNLAESWHVVHGFVINDLPIIGREDYEFAGWYLDEQLENRISLPYTVLTQVDLWAKWIINSYSVTYVTNSEYTLDKTYFDAGTAVNELSTPTKPHYQFAGWYVDEYFETPFTYGNNIHSDITVYAKWSPIYHTVTWVRNGGQENLVNSWFDGGNIYGYGGYEGTYEGYNFAGWYYDEELTEPVSWPVVADRDYTFYAKWDWIDPYSDYILISNADELASIYKMDGKYLLTADIDMTDYQDVNVRFGTAENHFTGIFDGGGHRIYNFKATKGNETDNFGFISFNYGTIKNVKIQGEADYDSWNNSSKVGGGLVGLNYGTIMNCQVDINVAMTATRSSSSARSVYLGGICGKNMSGALILNCINLGNVTLIDRQTATAGNWSGLNSFAAGIAGLNESTIDSCVNIGTITLNKTTGSSWGSGQLSSFANGGSSTTNNVIRNCLALGNLAGTSVETFSDIGVNAVVTNCYKINTMSYSTGNNQNKGTSVTKFVVDSESFYANDLLFDSEIWNYEELDFDNGITVRLR